MGPKIEAACRFVEQTRRACVVTSLEHIAAAVRQDHGTVVVAQPAGDRSDNIAPNS
jgi:carbamate kinase